MIWVVVWLLATVVGGVVMLAGAVQELVIGLAASVASRPASEGFFFVEIVVGV